MLLITHNFQKIGNNWLFCEQRRSDNSLVVNINGDLSSTMWRGRFAEVGVVLCSAWVWDGVGAGGIAKCNVLGGH